MEITNNLQDDIINAPSWFKEAIGILPSGHILENILGNISYSKWNSEESNKNLILLIHGTGAHKKWWDPIAPQLTQKSNVIAVDLPGMGESEFREKYTSYREMLLKNEISLYQICETEGLILTTDNLAPFSHWITPEIEERRFDTRFFIACLPDNQTGEHDGSELTDSLWINPKEALKKAFNGDIQMIMPTIKNLQQCENYNSASKLLEDQKKLTSEDIPAILPKFFKKDGNWVGLLPDDPDYKNH